MATTSQITGRVLLPNNAAPVDGVLKFVLSGMDTDTGEVIAPYETSFALEVDGDLPTGCAIYQNSEGLRGTIYRVYVLHSLVDAFGAVAVRREIYLGNIQINTAGPHLLSVLLNAGAPTVPGSWIMAITQEQYDAAIDAAATAEAAAAQALLAVQFTANRFTTTAGVTTYATGDGGALNVTATNHMLFGASPAGPQTYEVDYIVSAGAIVFLIAPLANELYTVLSMPRFTNSEAQVILQEYKDQLVNESLAVMQSFGLGVTGAEPEITDIENVTRPSGSNPVSHLATGVFPEGAGKGILDTARTSGGWVRETFTYRGDNVTNAGRTYRRVSTNPTTPIWAAWRRLLDYVVGQAFGYDAGNGGAVTQATSRTTGVTLDKPSGRITMITAAGSATWASFTLTNSTIAVGDTIILTQQGGTNTYMFSAKAQAGSVVISFATTGGTASDAPIINFAVIKTSGT